MNIASPISTLSYETPTTMDNSSVLYHHVTSSYVEHAPATRMTCWSRNVSVEFLQTCIVPKPGEWVLIAAYIVIFAVGLLGNIMVCFAVWRNKEMRTVTNIFMVNLSVADLAVIVILLPTALIADVTGTWFFGTVMCRISIALGVSISVCM